MADTGVWDRPDYYDASFKNCNEWGNARWSTPGILVDGEVITTNLRELNAGMEEFVEHSYYEDWDGHRFKTDPFGETVIVGILVQLGIDYQWKLVLILECT